MAALPLLAYLAFHALESAFITPLILGRRLELNAVAILIALVVMVAGLAYLALAIYGLLQARQGKLLRYPINLRLIK